MCAVLTVFVRYPINMQDICLVDARKETRCMSASILHLAKNTSQHAVHRHVLERSQGPGSGQEAALALCGNKDHLIMQRKRDGVGCLTKLALNEKLCLPFHCGQTEITQGKKSP